MINKFSYKIILRKDQPNKVTGACPLSLQCFINGERKVFSLNLKVTPEQWDEAKQRVVKHPNADDYNIIIDSELSKATEIVRDYRIRRAYLNVSSFVEEYTDFANRTDFISFMEKEINQRLSDCKITSGTAKAQKSTLNKLRKFQSKINIAEINLNFIERWDKWHHQYLIQSCENRGRKQKNNSTNTKAKAITHIKTYFNLACKRKGVKIDNPFVGINNREVEGDLIFLDKTEIQSFYNVFIGLDKEEVTLQQSMAIFLFSCFTGLRISDAKRVQWLHINNDYEIELKPVKTLRYNKKLTIPMNDLAKFFYQYLMKQGILTIHENTINLQLKRAARMARIKNKNISTHVARHTFATMFIASGGNVVYLQQILGHSDIRTTMRYVHVVDKLATEMIAKLNNVIRL